MGLSNFDVISQKPENDRAGLVWAGEVQEGKYFAELQTGILPQLVHLVIFDMESEYTPVYTALEAFELGTAFDEDAMGRLQTAIGTGLAELNS